MRGPDAAVRAPGKSEARRASVVVRRGGDFDARYRIVPDAAPRSRHGCQHARREREFFVQRICEWRSRQIGSGIAVWLGMRNLFIAIPIFLSHTFMACTDDPEPAKININIKAAPAPAM